MFFTLRHGEGRGSRGGEAALNQFSQELGDTFQVLCCGARPYGTQTPWAPVSQPAQRVQPKPPDVRQSLSRKQVSPHFWPTGRGAGVGERNFCERWPLELLEPLACRLKGYTFDAAHTHLRVGEWRRQLKRAC